MAFPPSMRFICRSVSFTFTLSLVLPSLFIYASSSNPSAPSSEIRMGTTIVACRFDGGVVVGADTRTSVSGYVSNRYAHKLSPLWDKCMVCRSGSAADTQHVVDQARWTFWKKRFHKTVSQAAHWLRYTVKKEKLESVSLICTGYDDDLQRGIIYSISPSGSLVEEPCFTASGSGSSYILGHLVNGHDLKMKQDEAVKFVKDSIQLAMEQDGSSGGFVRIVVITKDGQRVITVHPSHVRENKKNNDDQSFLHLPGFAPPTLVKQGPTRTKRKMTSKT